MVDIRRPDFWGYLTLNGKNVLLGQDMMLKGSLMSLVAETLQALAKERTRGECNILLRISSEPFNVSAEGLAQFTKVSEVESLIQDSDGDSPTPGETYEDFYHRLLESDYPQASAEFIAAKWFDREVNPTTTLWLNDPKAIRFRVLNSRDEEYEAALPSEYESLKHYVQTTYPDFMDGLVFRTA